jgi:hypothetical protein
VGDARFSRGRYRGGRRLAALSADDHRQVEVFLVAYLAVDEGDVVAGAGGGINGYAGGSEVNPAIRMTLGYGKLYSGRHFRPGGAAIRSSFLGLNVTVDGEADFETRHLGLVIRGIQVTVIVLEFASAHRGVAAIGESVSVNASGRRWTEAMVGGVEITPTGYNGFC